MVPEEEIKEEKPKPKTKPLKPIPKLTISELLEKSTVSVPTVVGAFVKAGLQREIVSELKKRPNKQTPIATLPEFNKIITEYVEK